MKRLSVILALALTVLPLRAGKVSGASADNPALQAESITALQLDSIPAALDAKLQEYLERMDLMPADAACEEADFLISSVQDDDLRSLVAQKAYRHFRTSKVMGSENVSVHIYDRWFATFKAVFQTLEELDEAEFYAFINRKSLLGEKAVNLTLTDMKGRAVQLFGKGGKKPVQTVIFFYSTTCPKCLYIAHRLAEILAPKKLAKGLKINLFAIYTGDDDAEWKGYVKKNLKLSSNCKLKLYNLKGGDADFVTAYGVIQTPRLFLVDEDSVIIGRNLDAAALEILLRK